MKRKSISAALLGSALLSVSSLLPLAATAHEEGDVILRLGAAHVSPDESSSVITTATTGPLAGTSVGVGNSTQVGINVVYMWSDNWGLEVLAATPFEHDLSAAGLNQYGFSTTDLGSTKHLPPTFSAVRFFGDSSSAARPYLGLGLNYTEFFDSDLSSGARTELGASNLDLDRSFGISYRAGVDFQLDDKWILNASVWNIDIDTDASFNSALGNVNARVEIDPWVYMFSLGYKF